MAAGARSWGSRIVGALRMECGLAGTWRSDRVVEWGDLELFAANLNKSSQVSFEHAKPPQSILIGPYCILSGEKIREKNLLSHGRLCNAPSSVQRPAPAATKCPAVI